MLGMIAGGFGVAQGFYSGITGYRSGKSQQKAYKRMAEIARKTGEMNAAEIERTGTEGQKSMADAQARRLSRIEGMYAKSGLLLTGTPATAITAQKRMDQYAMNEYNEQVAFRAKIERMMASNQAAQYMGQAKAAGISATTSLIGGLFGAGAGAVQFGAEAQDWLSSLKQQNAMSPISQSNGMNYSYGMLMNNQFDPTSPLAGWQKLYHR